MASGADGRDSDGIDVHAAAGGGRDAGPGYSCRPHTQNLLHTSTLPSPGNIYFTGFRVGTVICFCLLSKNTTCKTLDFLEWNGEYVIL